MFKNKTIIQKEREKCQTSQNVQNLLCTINLISMRGKIAEKCDSIKKLLLEKNLKYGNSAIEPLRIFSKGSAVEGLFVRCDDKLSRIRTTGLSEAGEDQVVDLIGYLVLISIHMDLEKEKTEQGK